MFIRSMNIIKYCRTHQVNPKTLRAHRENMAEARPTQTRLRDVDALWVLVRSAAMFHTFQPH